jgi:hypothetical protein
VLFQKYQELFDITFNINIPNDSYLKHCGFDNIYKFDNIKSGKIRDPLDKIFCYTTEPREVGNIVQSYIDHMSKITDCEVGVLDGLTWCINEVMDNVLVHSKENTGYIMAQYHKKSQTLAICVFDCGIGIFESLSKNQKHKPASEIDSLTMALQEGVGDGEGQGNGLYGLYQIVKENEGELCITSGNSSIILRKNELKKHENIACVSNKNKCTIVDFKLNLSKNINIKEALKSIGGFDGFDFRIDNMIENENTYRYDVYEHCSGTGTRIAGRELKHDVLNIIKRTNSPLILDFSGIATCSSSFIDEFIAKLVSEIGMVKFNELLKIEKMNDTIAHLCNRAIVIRMHQEWSDIIDQK